MIFEGEHYNKKEMYKVFYKITEKDIFQRVLCDSKEHVESVVSLLKKAGCTRILADSNTTQVFIGE